MKKRVLALTMCAAMAAMTACGNVQTRDQVVTTAAASGNGAAQSENVAAGPTEKVPIQLLYYSTNEEVANIVRDQLVRAGFEVTQNMQPDYSSYKAQVDADNYDIDITGWTTVTGNPDYAVRSLFKTGGDYNNGPVADPHLDELIEKAASETPEEYQKTYAELEKYMVEEMVYLVPLYANMKSQAVNNTRLKPETVRLSKSRAMVWEDMEFVDGIDPKTETLQLTQQIGTLTSLDPIKGNDGSINTLNTNMYVRLVNLTDDDAVVSDGSLSYNYAIADGNQDYYFILRDDINFGRAQDGKAVDSGVMVGAEDVVYSLERAKNPDSVPNHKTYTLHEHIGQVEVVTDIAKLEGTKVSGSDKTVRQALEDGLAAPITSLVEGKADVDNQAGKYQVVKITATTPFPQILNYLAHQSAGIVDKEMVESVNTYDIASYDVSKDVAYGDQSTVTKGSTYNNTLSCSGPYVLIERDDYGITFQKNPAYMPGTDHEAKIDNVYVRVIASYDSQVSALRSGEIDVVYSVPEDSWEIVEGTSNLTLNKMPSNGVSYMTFNMTGAYGDLNLRKAVLASINQDEVLAVLQGRLKDYSTLTPLVDTGNELVYEPGKAQEYLAAYLNSK